jgi:hypothetical protein
VINLKKQIYVFLLVIIMILAASIITYAANITATPGTTYNATGLADALPADIGAIGHFEDMSFDPSPNIGLNAFEPQPDFSLNAHGPHADVSLNSDGLGHSAAVPYRPLANDVKLTGYGTAGDVTQWPAELALIDDAAGFAGGVYDGAGGLWMIPLMANSVVKVDTTSGEMTVYDSWPDGFALLGDIFAGFTGGVYDGAGGLWMIPFGADAVIKVNTTSGEMTMYDSWPDGFTFFYSAGFMGGAYDGAGGLWLIPTEADSVVRVDTTSGEMTAYKDRKSGV